MLTDFDHLELAVTRHAPLTPEDKEQLAARQAYHARTSSLRQHLAAALAHLSQRIDPSVQPGARRLANN